MNCPLCGSSDTSMYHDKIWTVKGKVFECKKCDLLFISCQMTENETDIFYQNYGDHVVKRGFIQKDDPENLYYKILPEAMKRLDYIGSYFNANKSILEIGAAAGSFVGALINYGSPSQKINALETCLKHSSYMKENFDIKVYQRFDQLPINLKFDIICLFHVFEHILDPASFLQDIHSHIEKPGKIIIEVPSSNDPLLRLYDCDEFKDFYFQPMHPFVYSPKSLEYILSENAFKVERIIPYQRYGLDNHLKWLVSGKDGDIKKFHEIIGEKVINSYKMELEKHALTDSVFVIASPTNF
jgi:SAM-dependent methyltransferase